MIESEGDIKYIIQGVKSVVGYSLMKALGSRLRDTKERFVGLVGIMPLRAVDLQGQ